MPHNLKQSIRRSLACKPLAFGAEARRSQVEQHCRDRRRSSKGQKQEDRGLRPDRVTPFSPEPGGFCNQTKDEYMQVVTQGCFDPDWGLGRRSRSGRKTLNFEESGAINRSGL